VPGRATIFDDSYEVRHKHRSDHTTAQHSTTHGHPKLPACLRACVPACLRACVPACLRACVPACLRACVLIDGACSHWTVDCVVAAVCLHILTLQHEVWNNASVARVVLMIDVWHPDLDEAGRDLVRSELHYDTATWYKTNSPWDDHDRAPSLGMVREGP
jgi:hypothetical protein